MQFKILISLCLLLSQVYFAVAAAAGGCAGGWECTRRDGMECTQWTKCGGGAANIVAAD
jgi:hypothetical protein